ncbi:MAG TPA: hypothetical protein VFM74_04160 [Candidatus Limnocylindria bacterium]|nr:hypothetical protein [Candidatus Limnocylindria bacterium]
MSGGLVHATAVEVAVSAERAFEYLSDGLKQSEWALGSWNREEVGEGMFRGTSLFTGEPTYVRILASRELLLVDYEVGPAPDRLHRVNSARVIAGPALARGTETCVVTLIKWRLPDQDDDSWRHACATFDTEIRMIKGRLERGF